MDSTYNSKAGRQKLRKSWGPFLRYPGRGRRAGWAYAYYHVIGALACQLTQWYRSHASSTNMKGGSYCRGRIRPALALVTFSIERGRKKIFSVDFGQHVSSVEYIWAHKNAQGNERKRMHQVACQVDDVIKSIYSRECFLSYLSFSMEMTPTCR